MLSRQDLTSPSRQDKNAGNSGDLVKHNVYLAILNHLARSGKKTQVVEAHCGKGVYVSSNPHLRRARESAQYSTSTLGQALVECFAPPSDGLGVVADLAEQEIAYAGSGALHAKAVANGLADSLELLDTDSGVRAVADRIFSEDCFSKVRGNLRTSDPDGPSEPMVLSRLEAGGFGPDHVLHLDPFAFVMAPEDERCVCSTGSRRVSSYRTSKGAGVDPRTDLMRGTLDLLILRSLLATPLHGLGIARRISHITQGSFEVKPGSLFPALYRLEERGLIRAEWGESDTRRRAKFYRLTRMGRKQLEIEQANWRRIALAMDHALESTS